MVLIKHRSHVWRCVIVWGRFSNGRIAMQLHDAVTCEPMFKVTVNLVEENLAKDEIALNQECDDDVEASLVTAGIIAPHHRQVRPEGSWTDFRICKLLVQPL